MYDFEDLSGIPCRIGAAHRLQLRHERRRQRRVRRPRQPQLRSRAHETFSAPRLGLRQCVLHRGQANASASAATPVNPAICCPVRHPMNLHPGEPSTQGGGFCQQGNCIAASDCDAREVCVRDPGRVRTPGLHPACDMLDPTSCGEEARLRLLVRRHQPSSLRRRGYAPRRRRVQQRLGQRELGTICLDQPTANNPNRACAPSCATAGARGQPCAAPNPTCARLSPGSTSGSASHHATRCNVDSAPATTQPRTAASPPTPKSGTAAQRQAAPAIQPVIPPPPRRLLRDRLTLRRSP